MYGGLGRHVHALADALVAAGHDVVVLTQGPAGLRTDEPAAAGRPRVVRAVADPEGPDAYTEIGAFVSWLQGALVEAYTSTVHDWVPEVVHGHDWVVAEAARAIAARTEAPLVATMHATEHGLYQGHLDSDFSRWRHSVECDLVRTAGRTITCSAAMRDEVVAALGADERRVRVVPNGVHPQAWVTSPDQRHRARDGLGLARDTPLLVFVGRLEHQKGAQDAIAAVASMADRRPAPHLVLVGDGARRDDLLDQARRQQVSHRVHLVGRRSDADVAALLGAADAALVPSRYEPFGIVALEAMAAGAPVVVTTAGGLDEIVVDGVSGLVVPPADAAALARAIATLLDDPAQARTLRDAAEHRVHEHYTWDSIAAQTARIYTELRD